MCGRFTLRAKLNLLLSQFAAEASEQLAWEPRYNIAPTQSVLTVRTVDGKWELVAMGWGLIPSWAKDAKTAQINARAETVAEKPMFRSAFKKRRCLVLADGYYEWLREGATKLPHFYEFHGGAPFAIAGIWESWKEKDTCALLTTDANELASQVHDRMPVILHEDDYDDWLAGEQIPLLPFPDSGMTVRQVSQYVNNSRNQGPECTQPL